MGGGGKRGSRGKKEKTLPNFINLASAEKGEGNLKRRIKHCKWSRNSEKRREAPKGEKKPGWGRKMIK